MRLFALITARCSSSRFPNKVISLLGGKPMIEQIIVKCKNLKGLDGIVVSTSYLSSDNVIQDICEDNKVECYRGDIHDLASRHLETWNEYGLTHVLGLSGDSPFFDLEMAQRVVCAIREKPDYWSYGIYQPLGVAISGHPSGGIKKIYLEKQIMALRARPDALEMEEQYWCCYSLLEGDPLICLIDCTDIMPPAKTAIKIDIDYPLEMAIMNRVIDHLGFFPQRYSDIERAYTEITEL